MPNQESKTERPAALDSMRLLGALASLASLGREPVGQWVKVIPSPQHTRNLFGPIEEIAGKTLRLVERNEQGDCCCVFDGRMGTNLVDVDRRDIAPND